MALAGRKHKAAANSLKRCKNEIKNRQRRTNDPRGPLRHATRLKRKNHQHDILQKRLQPQPKRSNGQDQNRTHTRRNKMNDKQKICAICKRQITPKEHYMFAYGNYYHENKIPGCAGFKNRFPKFYQDTYP